MTILGDALGKMRLTPRRKTFYIDVDKGAKGRWRWSVRDRDGRFLMGCPPRGYGSRASCERDALEVLNSQFVLADPDGRRGE